MNLLRTTALAAALTAAGLVAACDGQSDAEKVSNLLAEAQESRTSGELDTAVIKLKNALQIAPDNAEARRRLGEIHLTRGDAQSAAKEFGRAIEHGADSYTVQANRARALLASGDANAVLKDVPAEPASEALADPAGRDLYGVRAQALAASDEPDAAQALGQRVLSFGENREARMAMAQVAAQRGDTDAVLNHVDAALGENAEDARALMMKARALTQKGDVAQALEAADKARQAAPGVGTPDLATVELALKAGERDRAWGVLDEIDARYDQDPRVRYFKALRALSEERYADARDMAEAAVGAHPDFVRAAYLAGAANLQLGNNELARSHLQRFVADNPQSVQGRTLLAQALRNLGEETEAREVLAPIEGTEVTSAAAVSDGESAEALDDSTELQAPDAQPERIQQVLQDLRERNYAAALEKAEALESEMADSPTPLQLQAIVLWARGDHERAVQRMSMAAEVAPENIQTAVNLARMHRSREDADKALAALEAALAAHPDNAALKVEAARAYGLKGDDAKVRELLTSAVESDPESMEARIYLARAHLIDGDAAAAQKVAEAAPSDQADNAALLEIRGRAQYARGQREAALATFKRLTEVAGDRAEGYRWVGETLLALDRPVEAVGYLEEARERSSSPQAIELDLVRALIRAGETRRADELLSELSDKYPEQAEVAVLRGNYELSIDEDPQAAVSAFERALELEPSEQNALNLARLLRRTGETDAAAKRLAAWREQNGRTTGVDFVLAELRLAQGQIDAARALYSDLVNELPENASVRNNLAWTLTEAGELDDALEHAKKAVSLAPDSPPVRDTLGVVYLRRGEIDSALSELSKAAEAARDRADIQLHYVEALVTAGRTSDAREVLARVDTSRLQGELKTKAGELRSRLR